MFAPRIVALLTLLLPLAHAAERDITRSFAVGAAPTVVVDSYRGAITIRESDGPNVEVAVHLELGGETPAAVERLLGELQLELTAHDGTVSVRARHPQETGARFVWQDNEQIVPTFRLTVPRRCNLELRTQSGTIVVGDVIGRVQAVNENGDVFCRRVAGEVHAATGTGDVVISHCDGNVTARVGSGTLRAGVITGRADLANRSGDVEVMQATGPLTLRAAAGNALVGIPRTFLGPGDIETEGGSVRLRIDPEAACALDAVAGLWGRVENRMHTGAVEAAGRRTLRVRFNAGGPTLKVRAKGGDVRVEPAATPFS